MAGCAAQRETTIRQWATGLLRFARNDTPGLMGLLRFARNDTPGLMGLLRSLWSHWSHQSHWFLRSPASVIFPLHVAPGTCSIRVLKRKQDRKEAFCRRLRRRQQGQETIWGALSRSAGRKSANISIENCASAHDISASNAHRSAEPVDCPTGDHGARRAVWRVSGGRILSVAWRDNR